MLKSLVNLVRRKPAARKNGRYVPSVESMEKRELMSVSNLFFSGNRLVVQSNNVATNVTLTQSGSNVIIRDVTMNRTWTYNAASVGQVEFQGGAGNDRFVNYIANMSIRAFGGAGNDYLEGYNGNDVLVGGAGNDTLVGYGGNDQMWGDDGDDILRGMAGNDSMQGGNGNDIIEGGDGNDTAWGQAGNDVLLGQNGDDSLIGGDGNDQLNGGAGNDRLWGENGNDVLINLDAGYDSYAEGGAGTDTFWLDTTDAVNGSTSGDKVHRVGSFANGADRTLNGDRIADPTRKAGAGLTTLNNKLFSSAGPRLTDIDQGSLGDCWLLAGLGAIALDNPQAIRHNVVDFNDGTYGVALGGRFYRVDNDFATTANGNGVMAYAGLGAEGSVWVAVVEKAYAHYRTGANTYASLEGGWSVEVNRAFGSTSAGAKTIQSYGNATALVNDMYNRWANFQAVTIGFLSQKPNTGVIPLVMGHMYTVAGFVRNAAGAITGVRLRNPWGTDGGGNNDGANDGFVTVTPAQLFAINGSVNWGRV